jgi:hypothetical protein
MNRLEVLNRIAACRGFDSYLEIGVHNSSLVFDKVECDYKTGVDPDPKAVGVTHRMTSDQFFRDNRSAFDLIFIDGCHDSVQVFRDILNAVTILNHSGVIVLHDCLPPDAWHQRPASEYNPGELWTGDVWKAALRWFNVSNHLCRIVDCDYGCGFVDTAIKRTPPREQFSGLLYERDFPKLRPYVITPERFLQLFEIA